MKKQLAIMQPYIFPYIGYFQLINYVDKFVFYDDVSFIKQGWINRNKITVNDKEHLFTIPLVNGSSNTLIKDVEINQNAFNQIKKKLYKSIEQSYRKAKFFPETYSILKETFGLQTDSMNEMAQFSVKSVAKYLELNTEFSCSKEIYENENLRSQERVIDICKIEKAYHYINPIGGQSLYSKEVFQKEAIKLSFIKSNEDLNPKLIVDLLMNYNKEEIKNCLNQYTIT